MDDLISKLSEIRSDYNCFNEDEEPQYRALSEAIRILSQRADGDTISRQAAIDAALEDVSGKRTHEFNAGAIRAVNRIKSLPSAQPERKQGKWIYGEHDVAMCDGYRCDKCGFFVPWDYQHKFIDFINDYHFCPNCGADMRGERDETD